MALRQKLLDVMKQCAFVGKDGYNKFNKYRYITAAKINDTVNSALVEAGIATTAESELLDLREVATKEGKAERLATVKIKITLYDVDSEDTLVISGVGSGQDVGDKGIAKAQTMAVKYAWKDALLIADASDDPDSDSNSDSDGVGEIVPTDRPGGAPAKNPYDKTSNRVVGKCEKCGGKVLERNMYYSHEYYGGKFLCYNCQKKAENHHSEPAPFDDAPVESDVPF